jgi:DNA-binding beta-propeller fold protein YncE
MKSSISFRWFLLSAAVWILLGTHSSRADHMAYVANSYPGDETLSKINLSTGEVFNNILFLGESPNQIVIQGNSAYVVNSLDHDIQIIDLITETTVGYIDIGEPRNPYQMAFVDERYAYVTNLMSYTISKVDLFNQTVVGEYGVGIGPEGLIKVGGKLYICCAGFQWSKQKEITGEGWMPDPVARVQMTRGKTYLRGMVYVFDLSSETVVDSIAVGTNPQYIDLDPEGELNVLCTGDYWSVFGQIYRIDPNTNTVIDSIPCGGSPGIISIGTNGVGYIAAGGWHPDPGLMYTFDSYADIMIRGSTNPVTTDSGVISVTAMFGSQVLTCNYQGDDIARFNSAGDHIGTYMVGNGPISTAVYSTPYDGPVLGREGIIILMFLLLLAGSLFLIRKTSTKRA